jgi:predicted choloylglycine hydrolase
MGIPSPVTFRALSDDEGGHRIAEEFHRRWPFYTDWLLSAQRKKAMPSAAQCLDQLYKHMPELLPAFRRLDKVFGSPQYLPQFLCLYNPPTIIAGCSQAVWRRDNEIALIRNYDFPQNKWDAMQLRSNWNGTGVIATTDCFWGVLDGMNEHGLAVSLSFGGKLIVGDGFAITLVLRYILEFCATTAEAEAVLRRLPVSMAYNVVLVDKNLNHKIVYVGPGQEARSSEVLCTTNHQRENDPDSSLEILSDSGLRQQFLAARVADKNETLTHFEKLFALPPLYRKAHESRGWGTLYTASYYPLSGRVTLNWPGRSLHQSFASYSDCDVSLGSTLEEYLPS